MYAEVEGLDMGFCIKPAGDSALLVQLGNKISPELNAKVRALNVALQHNPIEGVIETVPAYCSLLVCFDPLKLEPATLRNTLKELWKLLRGKHFTAISDCDTSMLWRRSWTRP